MFGARADPRVVLVVEDDPQTRELYATALRAGGFAVFTVEDGVDALRYIEIEHPAAVVLDLGLPRLHGIDVQREMAGNPLTNSIPIVVVTGDTRDLNESDFQCVLRKPIDPDDLVSAVQKCLRGRK